MNQSRDLPIRERCSGTGEQRCDVELDLGEIVGLQEFAAKSGASISDPPHAGFCIAFVIQREAGHIQFLAILPHERPASVARDALSRAIHLRRLRALQCLRE